ncbi:MAG: (d)CMP kinase [Bacteroidales bacterium]|nr:(d)CMP kinase [Bacteroidales bacterium]
MIHSAIIAIDGYSSSGKSTFARAIASELGYIYIDSGAMYRAVTLYCLENGILTADRLDHKKLTESLDKIDIEFSVDPETRKQFTLLNGINVEDKIRGIGVSEVVSKVSQVKEVRSKMVRLQRNISKKGGVVMEGRDIGTVVFPDAGMKIFMTAAADIRARRRYDELAQKGVKISYEEVLENIRMRDREDENRIESPLRKAEDALTLDNSNMTPDEQMRWFRRKWKSINRSYENQY